MSHFQDLNTSRPQDLSGVLVVDKTAGPTSHDVVTLARRSLGVSRIGHTGTLDPMATGVLPLVIGRATRLAQFLTAGDKSYEATIAFGRTTDTHDATGTVASHCDRRPSREALDAALAHFRGTFEQTPPIFSAKNIDGERSYALARKAARASAETPRRHGDARRRHGGTEVRRAKPVSVTVEHLECLSFDGDSVRLEMQVGAGFYVRALAHDLGEALGCGAVLVELRRTRSGEFGLDRAVPLADILQSSRDALAAGVVPFRALLPEVPAVTLRSALQLERLKNGVEMGPADLVTPLAAWPPVVRLLGPDGDLVGLAKPSATAGNLHGWVVLA